MELILLERIEKLGAMGDVVKVRSGYARNYLLPQRKAVRATEENLKRFEGERSSLEALNTERRGEAERVAATVDGTVVILIRQAGDSGQLYGSVTARDIAQSLDENGLPVKRQQVWLSQPIKSLGLHPTTVNLHPEVSVTVVVNVARSQDEAATQARTGRAVLGAGFEEDQTQVALEARAESIFEDQIAREAIESIRAEEEVKDEIGTSSRSSAHQDASEINAGDDEAKTTT